MDHPPTTDTQAVRRLPDADPWRFASSMATHPSSCDGGEPLLAAIAGGLAGVAVPWDLTSANSQTECSQLLLATDHYDAWLVYWPAGSVLAMPARAGASGAFSVVDGVLDDDLDGTEGRIRRQLGRGDVVIFSGDQPHVVVNRGGRGATSVHVYSPPLSTIGQSPGDIWTSSPWNPGSWNPDSWSEVA